MEWTLGCEGVEVEVDLRERSYRVIRSACCMDVSRVINPAVARGQIVGAMGMALGFAGGESFMMYRTLDRMNAENRDGILGQARKYRDNLEAL
jgi:CO/xanthine dehydrogenase Mo-binding subunit